MSALAGNQTGNVEKPQHPLLLLNSSPPIPMEWILSETETTLWLLSFFLPHSLPSSSISYKTAEITLHPSPNCPAEGRGPEGRRTPTGRGRATGWMPNSPVHCGRARVHNARSSSSLPSFAASLSLA